MISYRDKLSRHLRTILHIIVALLSWWLAFIVRFEGHIPESSLNQFLAGIPVILVARTFTYYVFGLNTRMWRYTSSKDVLTIGYATALGSVLLAAAIMFLFHGQGYSRSVFVIDFFFNFSLVGGKRFFVRMLREKKSFDKKDRRRVLVVGAGDAGEMIVREMLQRPDKGYFPVAFVDDNSAKLGHRIHGVPILGTIAEIPRLVHRQAVDEIVIAIPSANSKVLRNIFEYCRMSSASAKALPHIADIIAGRVTISHIRKVSIEDLLGREPVDVNLDEISGYITERCVMVTGAGGSIGSELCRQIAEYKPNRLILVDHDENAIFAISEELSSTNAELKTMSLVLDVLNYPAIEKVFAQFKPDLVFHAAAHKHVPLMEHQVIEAVRNNVLGTLTVVRLSREYGVARLVYISTDKAVEPVNVMGMTKRVGELIMHASNVDGDTTYASVRFGNVLGSAGSVIPTFKAQIENGGPVTVTDPNMERYFMTIPEAVQLVIQSGAFAGRGETFILDMGKPVKIAKLAEDIIRFSGFKPGKDIDIVYTGTRIGEKLTEKLFWEGKESITTTSHPKIMAVRNDAEMSSEDIFRRVNELISVASEQKEEQALKMLRELADNSRDTALSVKKKE